MLTAQGRGSRLGLSISASLIATHCSTEFKDVIIMLRAIRGKVPAKYDGHPGLQVAAIFGVELVAFS